MEDETRQYVPLKDLNWPVIIGIVFVVCNFLFLYRYLDYVSHGEWISPWRPYIEQFTGFTAGIAVLPISYWTAIRFPLVSRNWWRYLPAHLAALCLWSFLHTSLMALQRWAIFPLVGLGAYDYGYMPIRYLMEGANDFIMYSGNIGAVYFFHELRFARERELRQAELEARLSEAQLQNLRLQLEPHFLFNALNAISATIYENPKTADEMIGRLSDLLRALLRNDRSQEVTLDKEVALLQLYTRIMEARMEERLKVDVQVAPDARECLVPQLLLQPLVENAIRYGADPHSFCVDISVSAIRENGRVRISVRDHGPGLAEMPEKTGIGLRNTRERLERLYGSSQSLSVRTASDGGAEVEVMLPFHTVGAVV